MQDKYSTHMLGVGADEDVNENTKKLLRPYVDGFMNGPTDSVRTKKGSHAITIAANLVVFDSELPEMEMINYFIDLMSEDKSVYVYTLQWNMIDENGDTREHPRLICRMAVV